MRASLPFVLLCTAAVALPGCGGDSKLLDPQSASALQESLQDARDAAADNQCAAARDAAVAGKQRVEELPGSVDDRLVRRLREGFEALQTKIDSDCQEQSTTTTDTTTTDTVPETTTDTQPPPTTTTTETTPPPTQTTPPPTTDPGDGDSGGVDPGADEGTGLPRNADEARRRFKDAAKRAQKDAREAWKDFRDAVKGDR
ncbi:hypothetical protein [Patulibacter defluvii]|uniref:hypothetical protein n=1 Tax=Patulibacter defluvii TaxID=3095358 RepID=UPI002A75A5BB|nr:hypothetical protein [Patulibacter sp. DM4]